MEWMEQKLRERVTSQQRKAVCGYLLQYWVRSSVLFLGRVARILAAARCSVGSSACLFIIMLFCICSLSKFSDTVHHFVSDAAACC